MLLYWITIEAKHIISSLQADSCCKESASKRFVVEDISKVTFSNTDTQTPSFMADHVSEDRKVI